MPLPPITLQLSKFEQLEICRHQLQACEEDFKKTEIAIRELLYECERLRYLQSLHPVFQELPQPKDVEHYQTHCAHREALHEAIQVLRAQLTQLETETAGQTAPGSRRPAPGPAGAAGAANAAAPGARRKFDNFDDFRSNRAGG